MLVRRIGVACAVLGLAAATVTAARADAIADFYKGKQVNVIVPFGAGGGYALYTQIVTRHLPKFVPGNPGMVPQYMPGAGGVKAANYVFSVAPKDGSLISMVSDSVVLAEVISPDNVRYRVNEFTWIGAMERVNNVLAVRADSGIKTVEDLMKQEAVMGSSGRGSPTYLLPSLVRWLLPEHKIKIVTGYEGINPMFLAMEQGELNGVTVSWTVFKSLRGQWFKDGFANTVVQFGTRREPDLPDVPLAIEVAKTDEQKAVARFMASNAEIGRSFVVPPGVPEARIEALRTAFDRMVKDPAFIEDAVKNGVQLTPATGAEVQQAVRDASDISPELAELVRTAIFGGN
jgi:tripartite-type tricarboxylate transporter receptor subunit TctC